MNWLSGVVSTPLTGPLEPVFPQLDRRRRPGSLRSVSKKPGFSCPPVPPDLRRAQLIFGTGVEAPLLRTVAGGRLPHSTPVAGWARTTPSSGAPNVSGVTGGYLM